MTRQPTSSTVPSISRSGERIQSPTAKGRSRKILSPPKKFASKSLAAKPTAMPPTPPKASSPDTDTPTDCKIMMPATTHSTIRLSRATALIVARSLDSRTPRCSPSNSSSIPRLRRCASQPNKRSNAVSERRMIASRSPSSTGKRLIDSRANTTHMTH